MERRLGAPEDAIRVTQGNLANTYQMVGQGDKALRVRRDLYSEALKLKGEEHEDTLLAASNYALSLASLLRCAEAKALLRKAIPVAQRVIGENDELTLRMRWTYAGVLVTAGGATLDDLREAVATLEDAERIARRVLGGAHPITTGIEGELRASRAALCARETLQPGSG